MSTKTSIKRIALVAVAALGFGMFSVPAFAGAGTATAITVSLTTEDDGVDLAASKYTSNPVRDANQISAFTVEASSVVSLECTAVGGTITTDDTLKLEMVGYGYLVADAAAAVSSGDEGVLGDFTAPSVAGTYTLKLTLAKNGTYAAATDLTTEVKMTVAAPAKFSSTLSTAHIISGPAATAADADTDAVTASGSATAAAANRGAITMTFKNTDGDAMASGNTVTAQITAGPVFLLSCI